MLKQRIEDVIYESKQILLPIEGYQNKPLVSLEEAVEPLSVFFDKKILQRNVWVAKERCKNPPDGLSQDESSSIMLYTFEWETREKSLYFILNQTLRMEDRQKLKPWFLYLKLFITALFRLPVTTGTIYRGVKTDLTSRYRPNEKIFWWGISSCTNNIDTLRSEQFCGKIDQRTIFMIKCQNGRSIQNHSYYKDENEILLIPGSYFAIIGQYNPSDDVHMVQLEEVTPPHDLFPTPTSNPWRHIEPGICLEGICPNKDCVTHQQELIIPIGFRKFNVLTDANTSVVKCPICWKYIKIMKICFSNCQWRWHGIKQITPDQEPIICGNNWSRADDYLNFEHDIQGAIEWPQLIIEAKP